MVRRAKDTHLEMVEGFGGAGGEEEVSGAARAGWSLKEAMKVRMSSAVICGAGWRAAFVLRISICWVRSATFLLVEAVVRDVPIVLTVPVVPMEALEAIESPELLMVETSSCAPMRAVMSSLCASLGTSADMMPLVMSWSLSASRSSSCLSWMPLIILVDSFHVESAYSFWASLVASFRRVSVLMFFVSLKQWTR